jgi:hypothetical protein
MKVTAGLLVLVICFALLAGCRQPTTPGPPEASDPPWFEETTAASGLNFVHDAGPVGSYFMPQSIGSGAALLDFDNDGLLDLYLLHNGGPTGQRNQLLRQRPDGTFQDISAGSGLDVAGYSMGVAVGDVNNDGFPDVLLTQYGAIRLFLNNGNGTFREVSKEAGLHSPLWAVSAAFLDYDRDGWLDLVVVNYVDYDPTWDCAHKAGRKDFCAPQSFKGTVAKLFHNKGAAAGGVGFEDVSLPSGLGRKPAPGLGVLCADFNGDGWPDIFIANDGAANHLWINQKNGTFKEEAIQRGVAYNAMGHAEAGMGVAVGDVDGDGLFDLFVTHLTWESNTLWKQGPRGSFQDRTTVAGLGRPAWRGTGWGTTLSDFDHDGILDVALVNGRVSRGAEFVNPELGPFWQDYGERNQLFAGTGAGHFRDLSPANAAFCGKAWVSRGLVVGDLRNVGALDLVTTEIAGPARLFRNVAPKRGHWVVIRALDPRLKRDAYGAEVVVRAGDRRWWRLVNPGSSFACSNDPRVHVGVGAVERIDAIEVLWPDGLRESFTNQPVDHHLVLRRGEGRRLTAQDESTDRGKP